MILFSRDVCILLWYWPMSSEVLPSLISCKNLRRVSVRIHQWATWSWNLLGGFPF